VPAPPELVALLRPLALARLDGPLFVAAARRRADGTRPEPALVAPSNWWRALARIGAPSPYTFRHIHATVLVNTPGVSLGEAARRLGHSVDTLVSTYIGVQAGDEGAANAALTGVFAGES
jgi:integrase